MTHDDLTPEEREALSSLPRERAPSAGLEDRVVAAMRERGHLARRPARVIRLTAPRVAGLVAACVALVIGAYSIGLRSRIDSAVLMNVEPESRALSVPSSRKEPEIGMKAPETLGKVTPRETSSGDAGAQFIDKQAPAFKPTLNVPQLATPKDEKKAVRQDEAAESMQKTFSKEIARGNIPGATDLAAPSSPPMPAQLRAKSAEPEVSASAMSALSSTSRTFALHGGTLIVDAPDSLRIVQDEQGRTLLIYTSDGVIRIRLAD